MIKFLTILILLSFPIAILIYLRKLKSSTSKINEIKREPIQPNISYYNIPKSITTTPLLNDNLRFDITTIIHKEKTLDVLLTFTNNLGKHIRIEIKEITLYSQNSSYNGDFSFLDMNLGTNDYILKNTIIDGGQLIRNVHFPISDISTITGDTYIKITLNINQEETILLTRINESTVNVVKIIEEK